MTPTENAIREALQPERTARIVIQLTTAPLRDELTRIHTEYSRLNTMPCPKKDQVLKRLRKEFYKTQSILDEIILSMTTDDVEILLGTVKDSYSPIRQKIELDPGCMQ